MYVNYRYLKIRLKLGTYVLRDIISYHHIITACLKGPEQKLFCILST